MIRAGLLGLLVYEEVDEYIRKVSIVEHLSGVVRIMGVGIYKLAKPGFSPESSICSIGGV